MLMATLSVKAQTGTNLGVLQQVSVYTSYCIAPIPWKAAQQQQQQQQQMNH